MGRFFLLSPLAILFTLAIAPLHAAPVLMISIDGLKPEYITHADEHGMRIPTLRRFLKEGTYAEGVKAVLPTVTYPDHTTLITGVWPAEHGILNNQIFDPLRQTDGAWYWYAGDIHVPTLWDVAHKAGIGTASVSWPVSVNASSVDTLIPEYWRSEAVNPQDRELMAAISRPLGWLESKAEKLGPYMMGNDDTAAGDRIRTAYSLEILAERHPGFMTIHLSSLDETEHMTGPFSDESRRNLEEIDGMVARLIEAAQKNDPKTVIVVVSDHGFARVDHALNIAIPFLQAGLVKAHVEPDGKVVITDWKAEPWPTGGLAAIMLRDPKDTKTREQVKQLMEKLVSDPDNGIDRILERKEFAEMGGFPDAEFLLSMRPGFTFGGAFRGSLVSDKPSVHGTHGYLPTFPEMRASFFVMGEGVAAGRNLGQIDMRQIAPSVAGILQVDLPSAKQSRLNLAQ